MEIAPNKLYKPLFTDYKKYRYIICMGGRSSGRSFEASQFVLLNLLSADYFRCAIMRFILGDIRNSIFQEIRDRIEEQEIENIIDIRENALGFRYKGNKINGIGFRKSSGDQKSKLKSLASYNCVIIEEADEINEEDFQQLDDSLRTMKGDITVILLLNPPDRKHWIIKRWFNLVDSGIEGFYKAVLKSGEDDVLYIHGTYEQNIKNINQKTIDNFKKYKIKNPAHYWNMIKGLISEGARGRIFTDWKIIKDKDFEELEYPSYYGLDFGYSNDPAALVEMKEHNENLWLNELLYETGLTNTGTKGSSLSERFEDLGIKKTDIIWADSAEPKSIQELCDDGWDVRPAPKGKDSINNGIDKLISLVVRYTESSTNIDDETYKYKWALDKNKEPTDKAVDKYNHLCDSIRYGKAGNDNQGFIGVV